MQTLLGVSKHKRGWYIQCIVSPHAYGTHYLVLHHLLLFIFQVDCLLLSFTNMAWLKYESQIDSQCLMEDYFEGKSGHTLGIFGLWNLQFCAMEIVGFKSYKAFLSKP